MLKTAALSEKLIFVKIGDNEGNDGISSVEIAKKLGKLKSQKMSKSQKLAKSKKPSKSGNLPNFNAKDSGTSFLTPKAKSVLNRLRLTSTIAPILWHFDPECCIWIETNALGYAINGVLSQLASKTSLDGVVLKADLGQKHPVAFFSGKMIIAKA